MSSGLLSLDGCAQAAVLGLACPPSFAHPAALAPPAVLPQTLRACSSQTAPSGATSGERCAPPFAAGDGGGGATGAAALPAAWCASRVETSPHNFLDLLRWTRASLTVRCAPSGCWVGWMQSTSPRPPPTWRPARTLMAALAARRVGGWGWGSVGLGQFAVRCGLRGCKSEQHCSALRVSRYVVLPTAGLLRIPVHFGAPRTGNESHAGQVFTCVAALAIAGRLDLADRDLLCWW